MRTMLSIILLLGSTTAVANPTALQSPPVAGPRPAVGCALPMESAQSSEAQERVRGPSVPPRGPVALYIRKGHGDWCRGWGLCFIKGKRPKGPHCFECTEGTLERGAGDVVHLQFAQDRSVIAEELFQIDKNLALPPEVARQLGARGSMTILKGRYQSIWSADGRSVRVALRVKGEWAPEPRRR
jgi:hypothetical protein